MRGFLQPSLRNNPTESQVAFAKLSRHRRAHLAEAAQTTLLKASQWARGEAVAPAVAESLEQQLKAHEAKAAKKSS
ncbi:MAG: hypothetical protein KF819_22735 [Labilithrix sp.]|nr:hypothetical protein [Labilithrix sp.]